MWISLVETVRSVEMHLLAWGFKEGLARRYRDLRAMRTATVRGAAAREVAVTTDKSGRTSAGVLLWRRRNGRLEVLLAHQGGPQWVDKDLGHWTIPKGEIEAGEELGAVARRGVGGETGPEVPDTPLIELGEIRQKSGKLVLAWATRGDLDAATAVSNTYQTEWPPGSGHFETFPEIDRVEWFQLNQARGKR